MTTTPPRGPRSARLELPGRLLFLLSPLLLSACDSPGGLRVSERYTDLSVLDAEGLGRFQGATSSAAAPVEAREVSIHGDRRAALVVVAPTRLGLRAAPGATRLSFGLAVRPPDARLRIAVRSGRQTLHEEDWAEERDWVERNFDLGPSSEGPRDLERATARPSTDSRSTSRGS